MTTLASADTRAEEQQKLMRLHPGKIPLILEKHPKEKNFPEFEIKRTRLSLIALSRPASPTADSAPRADLPSAPQPEAAARARAVYSLRRKQKAVKQ